MGETDDRVQEPLLHMGADVEFMENHGGELEPELHSLEMVIDRSLEGEAGVSA